LSLYSYSKHSISEYRDFLYTNLKSICLWKKYTPYHAHFFNFLCQQNIVYIIHFWLCIGSSQDTYSISIRDRTNPLLISKLICFVFTTTDNITTGNFTNQSESLIHVTTTLLGNIIGKLFISITLIYLILISIHTKYTSIFSRLHYAFKYPQITNQFPFFSTLFSVYLVPKLLPYTPCHLPSSLFQILYQNNHREKSISTNPYIHPSRNEWDFHIPVTIYKYIKYT